MSGKSNSSKPGKIQQVVDIKKGLIKNTYLNEATEKIMIGGHTRGHAPLYLILRIPTDQDGDVLKSFTNNVSHTVNYALRGFLENPKIPMGKGEVYYLQSKFVETWL
jgi:hypothetical protein